jgi:outer membrane protein TolC
MYRLKTFIMLGILLIGFNQLALSQRVDLETYLNQLQHNSSHIKQSKNNIEQAEQDTKMAKAALLPSAGIESSYRRDMNRIYMYISEVESGGLIPNNFPMNFYNNISANAVVQQSIYNPVALANHKLAKLSKEYTELSHFELEDELKRQGTILFFQALYVKESIAVAQQNTDLALQQWNQLQDLFEEGYVSEFQTKQAEIYYKQTLPLLIETEKMHKSLLSELQLLAGESPHNNFDIEGSLKEIAPADNHIDSTLDENKTIKLLNKQIAINKQQIQERKAAYLPQLKASVGYQFDAYDDDFKFDNINNLGFAQLTLRIPIASGGFNRAQKQKSLLSLKASQIEKDHKKNELLKELYNSELNLNLASEKIKTEMEVITLSKKELEISEEKIKLGLVTNLELKEIRNALLQSELNLINAYLDYKIAQTNIQKIAEKK